MGVVLEVRADFNIIVLWCLEPQREGPIEQLDAQVWSQAEGLGQEKGTWESLTWGGHLTLRQMRFMSSVAGRGR